MGCSAAKNNVNGYRNQSTSCEYKLSVLQKFSSFSYIFFLARWDCGKMWNLVAKLHMDVTFLEEEKSQTGSSSEAGENESDRVLFFLWCSFSYICPSRVMYVLFSFSLYLLRGEDEVAGAGILLFSFQRRWCRRLWWVKTDFFPFSSPKQPHTQVFLIKHIHAHKDVQMMLSWDLLKLVGLSIFSVYICMRTNSLLPALCCVQTWQWTV